MDITLYTQSLIDAIGAKYMMEQESSDAIPPMGEMVQTINESNGKLINLISRYLVSSYPTGSDNLMVETDQYCYTLELSPRRAAGKTQAFADAMHSYLVNEVLAKVYSTEAKLDLSKKHSDQASVDASLILQLLHTKQPPIL